jgi:hypothetical protein
MVRRVYVAGTSHGTTAMAAAAVSPTSATGKGVVKWGNCSQKWNCEKDEKAAHGLTGSGCLLPKVVLQRVYAR